MSRMEQIKGLLAKSPDDVFLNFSLGMELQSAGEHEAAISQYDRTLELDANHIAAYMRKAQALMALRRHEEARTVLQSGRQAAQACNDNHMVENIDELLAAIPE